MPPWFEEAVAKLGSEPILQATLAALGTFILEDPTTIGCGLLVADRRMAFATALIGVSAGIALGDLGLYGLGRWAGPSVARRKWVSRARLDRAARWFNRNLITAIVVSRFVPGMRLPTYLAAGVLGAPVYRFLAVAVGASVVWTLLVLSLTVALGQAVKPLLGRARWPVGIVVLLLLILLQRRAARRIEAATASEEGEAAAPPVVSRFEFWPPWLFYIPVGFYYAWLSVRYGGPLLPTVANPSIFSGGLIGESKSEILDLVPEAMRKWVAPYVVFPAGEGAGGDERTPAAARRTIDAAGLELPLVAKPDVGHRGAGVQLLRDDAALEGYVRAFPKDGRIMFQRLAGAGNAAAVSRENQPERHRGVREAGVFYWRLPGDAEGRIFSITLKQTPELIGDGRRTVRELIEADPRAQRVAPLYLERHAGRADEVLDAGEVLPLVFAGNHCQGAIFTDGTDLATPALAARIDEISRAIPEFYFGRFDVRFDDLQHLLEGRDFRIIEINGAGAEATHIWDASARLGQAYGTLFRQFRILFRIGAANRRRGHRPLSIRRFLREIVTYRRLARRYPVTH